MNKKHNWRKDEDLQNALRAYLTDRGFIMPENVRYVSGIDFVALKVQAHTILRISLPPMSDYEVEETNYTHRYLRKTA
jgi:hypothetical protein